MTIIATTEVDNQKVENHFTPRKTWVSLPPKEKQPFIDSARLLFEFASKNENCDGACL